MLRSLGRAGGGTHVVSGSTHRTMRFRLPLLAAVVCAYVGELVASRYRSGT